MLQALRHQNVNWDDLVPEDILPLWEKWHTELPLLQMLTFPCCLKPPGFGNPIRTKIHSFSDASDTSLGQIYLCMINQKNEVHVSFLMAKSRVAPLKAIFIVRLELMATAISIHVATMLKSELDIENILYYHTDSEMVIGYINNNARCFNVYIGNPVQHIRDHSTPGDWFHVPGKENPADEASPGLTAKGLLENSRWFKGPQFLSQQDPLPFQTQPTCTLDPSDNEVRKETKSMLATKIDECKTHQTYPEMLKPDCFNHFSSPPKMMYHSCSEGDCKIETKQTTQLASKGRTPDCTRSA